MQNKMFLFSVYSLYKFVISKLLILETIHQAIVNKKDAITLISPAGVSLPLCRPGINMKTQQIYRLNSFSHSVFIIYDHSNQHCKQGYLKDSI